MTLPIQSYTTAKDRPNVQPIASSSSSHRCSSDSSFPVVCFLQFLLPCCVLPLAPPFLLCPSSGSIRDRGTAQPPPQPPLYPKLLAGTTTSDNPNPNINLGHRRHRPRLRHWDSTLSPTFFFAAVSSGI
jgi:hypothetical protein